MMNNAKNIHAPSKIYNGSDPKEVREFLSKIGIQLPEGVDFVMGPGPEVEGTMSTTNLKDIKPEHVNEPKYVPDKPAVTFDKVTLYCHDENVECSNEVRSCFCDIADGYNLGFTNIPADIASMCDRGSIRATNDNAMTIVRTIVSSFVQATSNLFWSLAKSVNDLAGNYGVKPFDFSDYDTNDYIKYEMVNIINEVFRKTPKEIEDIVNSGLFHYYMATAVNSYGASVHNTFACNIIPRMIPYMEAKDAENFYNGFNLLFRMFMGDLNYEACVLENTILADENPNVIMDNFKIADSVYDQNASFKKPDEIEG